MPKDTTAKVQLWGSYLDGKPIPDPYYGGKVRPTVSSLACFLMMYTQDAFQEVYKQCIALSNAFLDQVTGSARL